MVQLKQNRCDFCGTCVSVCPVDAIELSEFQLIVIKEKCIDCQNCIKICPIEALEWYDEEKI
ncbi:4Fe-4S binding protein [candidate division KSB1 bacterium]|nr:4Fe-4S binding protein [candidate division KSB1 bacterium]